MASFLATPTARLNSNDLPAPVIPPKRTEASWIAAQVIGWSSFTAFLFVLSALLIGLVRLLASFDPDPAQAGGLGEAIGNIVAWMLVFVMITATLLTMADRKWSALMQDRVGPNRARLPIPGLSDKALVGLPHIVADVLKMLFKEDFLSKGSAKHTLLFNLGPLLAFAPAFCLFAIVPVGPEVTVLGKRIALQVARLDWGILYVFALASIGVFGVALAGWASDNKFALLGGLRASAQLISYEVTLGLTLVGAFIAFGTLRLDEMVIAQGPLAADLAQGGADGSLVFGWLPAWGIFYQPIGMLLFVVAAMAEIKRAPFDTPEGESEIIGYFVEYSGLKSGLFLIAEYVETVVVSGIITAIYLGGYHLPWIEPSLGSWLVGLAGPNGLALLAVFQVFAFLVKTLIVIWFFFLVRWSFPRFRYDQIMKLGWKMILPLSLVNVMLSGFLFLWGGREGMAGVGLLELAGLAFLVWLSNRQPEAIAGGHGHGSHGGGSHGGGSDDAHGGHGHDDHGHAAPAHGSHGAAPVAAASH